MNQSIAQPETWFTAMERFGVPAVMFVVVIGAVGFGIWKVAVPWGTILVTTARDSMFRIAAAVEDLAKNYSLTTELLREMKRDRDQDREVLDRIERSTKQETGKRNDSRPRRS
jgi:hypothetical protein